IRSRAAERRASVDRRGRLRAHPKPSTCRPDRSNERSVGPTAVFCHHTWPAHRLRFAARRRRKGVPVILPKVRDPRFITIRRGGTLTDEHHHLLALWAATCAEHVLPLFEAARPDDPRPRAAIEHARAWARGAVKMMQAR